MAYQNKYSYTRPVSCNGVANYIKLLSYINKNGGAVSRRELLINVFGLKYTETTKYKYHNGHWARCATIYDVDTAKHMEGTWRGYQSSLFACLNSDDVLIYNKATRKWEIGTRGYKILGAFRTVYGEDYTEI